MPGGVARVQQAILEPVGVRENLVGLFAVAHELLDSEVADGNIKMKRRCHCDGR